MILRSFSRRAVLGAAGVLSLLPGLVLASPATDFVASFGDKISQILNSGQSLQRKRQEILPLLKANVDIPAIGRYCLGRYWRMATPEQQATYLKLFDHVLVHGVMAQIGNYQNISLRITESVPSPVGDKVSVEISRKNQPNVMMTVVVDGHPPKIIDLYGEGASMRLTQRSDYLAFMARHNGNVQALLDALHQQVMRNMGP
ncbi:MlaC/ttg2D family ABC transporter substrate-binding protein [Oecophyllibacter saccharovorans]|uniref:MlaC/ttg2D family ABC transporter substrate-binding protein n=1 Tax=Oecophyllibacter saccharovorans TaxID=2558360 RepID=UPI001E470BFE|nr:ABC transporter substrate-binding protein [Oecophyllibacter saccharovorans]